MIICDSGDVIAQSVSQRSLGYKGLALYNIKALGAGKRVLVSEFKNKEPQVYLLFGNKISLEVFIEWLMGVKEYWDKDFSEKKPIKNETTFKYKSSSWKKVSLAIKGEKKKGKENKIK